MKKIFIAVLTIIALVSCNNDDDNSESRINESFVTGRWNLTEIISSSGGSISPDENNTHSYEINEGGTFKRISIRNEDSEELEGSYNVTNEDPRNGITNDNVQKYLELSYSSSEAFFSNCGFDEQKELLILRLNGELENNLASPCDGPVLKYEKEI